MEENKEIKQVQDEPNEQHEKKVNTVEQSNQSENDARNKLQQYQQEKNLEKKKGKFVKVIRLIADIIFVPVFVIIVISSIIMFSAKMNNEVPSIFGISAVKVLTSSMKPDLSKGDIVIVKFVKDTSTLQVGDVISFYAYKENIDDGTLNNDTSNVNSTSRNSKIVGGAQNSKQRVAAEKASKVYIHKIDKIATPISQNDPNYGKLFFHTTGNVEGSDEMWIMEDYVIGLWDGESNSTLCKILQFIASSTGTIVLVIVPSLVLISIFGISLYKDYKDYKIDKENDKKEDEIRADLLKDIEDRRKQTNEKIEAQKQAQNKSVLEEVKKKEQASVEEHKEVPKVAPKVNLPPKGKVDLPPKEPTNLPPKK